MPAKCDRWIRQQAEKGMIEDYAPEQVRYLNGEKVLSYGVSSYGYDLRAADEWKVFTNTYVPGVVDPKKFDTRSFITVNSDICVVPPNSFVLARTVEYFRIPRNVIGIVLGKSTYARCLECCCQP